MPDLRRSMAWARPFALGALLIFMTGAEYLGQKPYSATRVIDGRSFEIIVCWSTVPQDQVPAIVDNAFDAARLALSLFDQDGSAGAVVLDPEAFSVFKRAREFSRSSEGAYDLTIGALDEVWDQARRLSVPPGEDDLAAALAVSGLSRVVVKEAERSLSLPAGCRLSWSDVADGYAIDKAGDTLRKNGVTSAVIQQGGSVYLLGNSQEGRFWRVGIDHPRSIEHGAAVLELPNETAVGAAGDYLDFFIHNGQRYSTILDPRTGRPPTYQVAGVTVTAKSAFEARLLAKAFFVMGPERGYEFINKSETGSEAVCIEESKNKRLMLSASDGTATRLKDITL